MNGVFDHGVSTFKTHPSTAILEYFLLSHLVSKESGEHEDYSATELTSQPLVLINVGRKSCYGVHSRAASRFTSALKPERRGLCVGL